MEPTLYMQKALPKRICNLQFKDTPESERKYHPDWKRLSGVKLPKYVDLRSRLPSVYDQGSIGSCTANAICGAYQYCAPMFSGSRLFLYYNIRMLYMQWNNITIDRDTGGYISDGINSLQTTGVCSEASWPYITYLNKNHMFDRPTTVCYTEALNHTVLSGYSVQQTIADMKRTLFTLGPFVVGIRVYDSFYGANSTNNGVLPMPKSTETYHGGHAILICGYNDNTQRWICRNSWGVYWGDRGYCYLPYAYLTSSLIGASDFWVITNNVNKPKPKPKTNIVSPNINNRQKKFEKFFHKNH